MFDFQLFNYWWLGGLGCAPFPAAQLPQLKPVKPQRSRVICGSSSFQPWRIMVLGIKGFKVLLEQSTQSGWWWLEPWNFMEFCWIDFPRKSVGNGIWMECHHPNWRSPWFFRGVGQPPSSTILLWIMRITMGSDRFICRVDAQKGMAVSLRPPWHRPFDTCPA